MIFGWTPSPGIRLVALVAAGLICGGYVRSTTTKSQKPVSWVGTNCVVVRANSAGSADVKDGSDLKAIERAAENWHKAIGDCAYMRIDVQAPSKDADFGFDRYGPNENAVVWIENKGEGKCQADDECSEGTYCDGCEDEPCDEASEVGVCCPKGKACWVHDPAAAGITTLVFIDEPNSGQDGRILDADIELNGAYRFVFATNGSSGRTDIENTVTHELGHVLGLDHPCDDGTRKPTPKDDKGKTIPGCGTSAVSKEMTETTMYNTAITGETKKRTPEADDVRGVCAIYPKEDDPEQCAPIDLTPAGCCNISGVVELSDLCVALVVGASLFFSRRRERVVRRRLRRRR